MIYVIYRCLYGEDFAKQAITSIQDIADKIFIFWDDTPWGNVYKCIYKNNQIEFPNKFDNVIETIKELNNKKVILIYDHLYSNVNQFTHFVNNIILPNYEKPNYVIFSEIDHVFDSSQLINAFEEFKKSEQLACSTRQIEFWRNLEYVIPERMRLGTIFWNLNNIEKIPNTGRHANLTIMPFLNAYVYNLGFAVSEKTMFIKFLICKAMSELIGDNPPNPDWYEKTWLNWHPEHNNSNLEISLGHEHLIPYAYKYNIRKIPECLNMKN